MHFYVACEFHHLKIVGIVYRDKGNLKCQGRTEKELKKSGERRNSGDI